MDFASRSLHLMGSTICISLYHERAEILLDEAVQLLHVYKNRFSANDEDSELMTINHLAGVKSVSVHPELFELIELGKYHSLAEGSHLNITIGPLVQTWRIGFSDARLPRTEEIQQALSLTDTNLLELNPEDCSVFLTKKGMKLDLGALAKGYIADKIKDYLLSGSNFCSYQSRWQCFDNWAKCSQPARLADWHPKSQAVTRQSLSYTSRHQSVSGHIRNLRANPYS